MNYDQYIGKKIHSENNGLSWRKFISTIAAELDISMRHLIAILVAATIILAYVFFRDAIDPIYYILTLVILLIYQSN